MSFHCSIVHVILKYGVFCLTISELSKFVSDWVTEYLLQKIKNNDGLAKKLSNPGFAQAMNEFQRNPKAAMAKYGNNPEMQAFLMEFCGLLGGLNNKMVHPYDKFQYL